MSGLPERLQIAIINYHKKKDNMTEAKAKSVKAQQEEARALSEFSAAWAELEDAGKEATGFVPKV